METKVITEKPIFTLSYESYNSSYGVDVYASDLKNAEIGTVFAAEQDNCGRAQDIEEIEIVYKSDGGCAVLYRHYGTTDSPNPKNWKDDTELIWVELH